MNIVLIGMPGVGKSTLGVLLAKALGMAFIDTDSIIQEHEGRILQEIIDSEGVDGFLKVEERAILGVRAANTVISTGGSVIYSPLAMAHLKHDALTVYLDAPYEDIESRLSNISTRGVVIKPGCSLQDVYNERVPLYKKYSDLTAACSERDIEGCVEALAASVRFRILEGSYPLE